ncbi:secreted antigen 1 [Babesia caballi]|uniref:Secreted antigen 1 n=1 Tax=Babesia caballi TaxID=5871 RepID=A0AAV4LMG3_BABCB|nr:secreted antigen 1 [Babesia caballi]
MAPVRRCSLSVPVPNTLKEALEFLDAFYTNVGGPKRIVVNVLGDKIQNDGYENISRTIENVLYNVNQLRLKIIGNTRLRSYGSYKDLKAPHDCDQSCANGVISILVHILPPLRTTLQFLEVRVRNFDPGGWGKEMFGGNNRRTEIHKWLTKLTPGDDKDQLPGGFDNRDLYNGIGNSLYPYLSHLVGKNNGCLRLLCTRIQSIAKDYPYLKVSPAPPSPAARSGPHPRHPSPRGPYKPSGGNSYGQYNRGMDSGETQPHGPHLDGPPHGTPTGSDSYITSGSGSRSVSQERQRVSSRTPQGQPASQPIRSIPERTNDGYHNSNGFDQGEPPNHESDAQSGSTAAIGGAVGGAGLVGGGAAVYFLNVGGIRTLIAG